MATKADLIEEVAALRADIAIISSELAREADERSWCPAYAEFVTTVNGQTSEVHLEGCGSANVDGKVTLAFSSLAIEMESGESIEDAAVRWFTETVVNNRYEIDDVTSVELDD